MRLTDFPWLTDENIHPDLVTHLRSLGLDVLDVKERGWRGRSDDDLLAEAYRLGRIILTHDGDFGTLALLGGRSVIGIVRIRPGHIRPEVTIRILAQLFAMELDLSSPFVVVVQGGLVRVHTWSEPPE